MKKNTLLKKIIVALIIISFGIQTAPAADLPSNNLPDAYHVNIDTANSGGYYIKFDGGGLNALHITTSTSEEYGQVTTTSSNSGTFYISDTGGRGFFNDMILMVAIKKPAGEESLPEDMNIRIKSSGFQWEPTGAINKPPAIDAVRYVEGAIDESYGLSSLSYGPQKWKAAGIENSPKNYPIYFGQDMGNGDDLFYFFFVDLKVGNLGRSSGINSVLQNKGMIKVEYSVENLDDGLISFNSYGWCDDLQSNQGKGISWTNALTGPTPSGYTVKLGTGGGGEGSGSSSGAIDYGDSGSDSQPDLPKVGNLNITSEPAGAKVFLDGAFTGEVTNASFTDLPTGDYGVYLELENYERTDKRWVTIRGGYVSEENFNLTLEKSSCFVESVPKGADIFLDGTDTLWHTDCELDNIEVGNHTITVSKPGFLAVSRNVSIEADKTAHISVNLNSGEVDEISNNEAGDKTGDFSKPETKIPTDKKTPQKEGNASFAESSLKATPAIDNKDYGKSPDPVVSEEGGIVEGFIGFLNSLIFGENPENKDERVSPGYNTGEQAANLNNPVQTQENNPGILNLSGEEIPEFLPEEKTGTVYVTSYPENLPIKFDGKDSGYFTPHLFYGVKEGIHKVGVVITGDSTKTVEEDVRVFKAENLVIHLEPEKYRKKVSVNLKSKDFRNLEFKIGDKNPEYSFPQLLTVDNTGTYVTVFDEGRYYSYNPGTLSEGEDVWVTRNSNFGKVSINSKPEGANIFVNGYDTGEKTPAVLDTLSEGHHQVQVSMDGYYPQKKELVMVDSKDEIDYEMRFLLSEYPYGVLSVNSEPEGCNIYLRGSYTGKKTPYTFEYMPIGSYDVMVMYNRTITEEKEVTVLPFDEAGIISCNVTMAELI
ncbi:PEGA domain-containing protein [Methanochimaera problematica]|nr:PEGA domain-containing protein [Methanoplanus sp. FWC-SCC4]